MRFNFQGGFVWVLFVCAILCVGGCSQNPVDTVKNGVLEMDSSVTVGDAFGGYHYFDATQWETFQDPQNRQIVEFNATFEYDQFADTKLEGMTLTADMLKKGRRKMGDLEITYTAQFAISKDKKSFNLSYSGFHMSGINSDTKERVEWDLADEDHLALQGIYTNTPVPQVWGFLIG